MVPARIWNDKISSTYGWYTAKSSTRVLPLYNGMDIYSIFKGQYLYKRIIQIYIVHSARSVVSTGSQLETWIDTFTHTQYTYKQQQQQYNMQFALKF